jgi:hypothetical protein
MILAIIVTILNALILMILAVFATVCKEIESMASDNCANAVNADETCFWFCTEESDCTGAGCEWSSDTCHDCTDTTGTDITCPAGILSAGIHSRCKGCEEGARQLRRVSQHIHAWPH